MDAMHRFDDDVPVIRRWWTDAAPEFATAAGRIRSLRPLAHYKSAPYRPQANGRAERYNRLMIEGTRCFLLQSGLGERWWPLAITLFCMNYNALFEGPYGLTRWRRRFGVEHEFRPYPFGVLLILARKRQVRISTSRRSCGVDSFPQSSLESQLAQGANGLGRIKSSP